MSPSSCCTEKRRREEGSEKTKKGRRERREERKKERLSFSNFYVQSTIYIFADPITCCACNLTDEEIEVQRS